jgi:hypothetical protein
MEQSAVYAETKKQDNIINEGYSFQGDHHIVSTSRTIETSEEGPSFTTIKRDYITTVGEKTSSKTRFVLSSLTTLDQRKTVWFQLGSCLFIHYK